MKHEELIQALQQTDDPLRLDTIMLQLCDLKKKIDKAISKDYNTSCARLAQLRKELIEIDFNIPEED